MYSDGKEFNVRELVEGKISRVKFVLTNMGLNDYQASALSHLIYLGETKATTLSKASGVPNARIYGILDELAKKGLLKIRPGRPMLYSPVTPNEIASALISEARDELRKRLKIVELNSDDFLKIANDIYLKAGIVNERTPLLRIVSVGDVSMNETQNLYKNAKKNLLIMTRAMEYYDDVAQQLRDVIKRGVQVKILFMSDKYLCEIDRKKRDETINKLLEFPNESVKIRLSDEVHIRGCIVDPESGGSALFLVEEVGVPYFLREAAITSHPGVVKGLLSMYNLIWSSNSKSIHITYSDRLNNL